MGCAGQRRLTDMCRNSRRPWWRKVWLIVIVPREETLERRVRLPYRLEPCVLRLSRIAG